MRKTPSEMRLFDTDGNRLYLNADERNAFLNAAKAFDPEQRALAETVCFTGCRISEALELLPSRCDLDSKQLIFRSLKKRRDDVYRAVPVPPALMDSLDITFGLRRAQKLKNAKGAKLFKWTRQHAWKIIKDVMSEAGIPEGAPHAMPKGLRHAYGIHAIQSGIPVTQLQKWMGHAQLSTTAIYVDFVGEDASNLAARMWN